MSSEKVYRLPQEETGYKPGKLQAFGWVLHFCLCAENNKQFSFENARLWLKKYYESKRSIPNHEILGAQHLSFIMVKW